MPNVLFVLYHDFTANSAVHVASFANGLSRLGMDCQVAVPTGRDTVNVIGEHQFSVIGFDDINSGPVRFRDGRGPDIVHAWTPREIVRGFCERLRVAHSFRLFVHLEDNERFILERSIGKSWEELCRMPLDQVRKLVPGHLASPIFCDQFLASAEGITVIIDKLREMVPAQIPVEVLWPSADERRFRPAPADLTRRRKYGIPHNSTVLVYTGNVHGANGREVRSLYLAVALLNREGVPATLVRAGRDFAAFLGPEESWAHRFSIELGYVPHHDIPAILALADIFVQPGKADHFNNYRFPSKLPEMFAMGRPVVLPNANIAMQMRHLQDAYVLDIADAESIAGAVKAITRDQELYQRLARGAREFFDQNLSWDVSVRRLAGFYGDSTKAMPASVARKRFETTIVG